MAGQPTSGVGPADSYATLYTMGTIAYTSVVLTATIQICYISPSTITAPLHACAVLTIGVWFLWQSVYSVVWPMFGLRTGYEQAGIFGQIMGATISSIVNRSPNEASLWWAVVGLATTLGVAPEWAFYKIRRYYFPTDAEKLRELDVLRERHAEQRKRLAHLVDEDPGGRPGSSPNGKSGREASLKPKRRSLQADLEMGAKATTVTPLATRSAISSTIPSFPSTTQAGPAAVFSAKGEGSARAQPGLEA
ncbi:hypothetical protein BCR44DRAFT_1431056 [Catenaria anguillulae PL171]|uniref:P-type ATPase C-terminal domain-containing protein n=1 Tax=Catenaria anguillulae PL171 TaxID=765915 RepID=A0A1Y2HS10_9FUNG|nr:hypothetical protein BCR44DRAFT_1431056 [Catenaria anguillulae PL171]